MTGERVVAHRRDGAADRAPVPAAPRTSGGGIAQHPAGRRPGGGEPGPAPGAAPSPPGDAGLHQAGGAELLADGCVERGDWRARSGVRRRRAAASCIPPSPSVSEWCSFMTNAARSSSSPSTRVNSQSGRVRSNAVIAAFRAMAITVAGVRGAGAPTRRRCHGQVEVGVDGPTGRRETRRRLEDPLPELRDEPGRVLELRGEHVPIRRPVEPGDGDHRRSEHGSRSMYQVNASLSRMKTLMELPLGDPSPLSDAPTRRDRRRAKSQSVDQGKGAFRLGPIAPVRNSAPEGCSIGGRRPVPAPRGRRSQ